ncbi:MULTISPECIES: VOC family protein [unclassified Brachybacterium]|uniref:VOC family protein n=1 Tax=unclassified Brachybacterium TaxID=2623841 RepID=UPI003605ACA4
MDDESSRETPRPHLSGWIGVVLSAPRAQPLAHFYRDLLGWPLHQDTPDWCTMQIPGAPANLAFQSEEHYAPPMWPAGPGDPHMMLHLDIGARDLEQAVAAARELGATVAEFQPQDDVRVVLDPAGHLFCLYVDG